MKQSYLQCYSRARAGTDVAVGVIETRVEAEVESEVEVELEAGINSEVCNI